MNYFKKTDWFRLATQPGFDPNTAVKIWVLPHGCICNVTRIGGVPILENGTYSAANSIIADKLVEAGVTGQIVVYTPAVIPQTTSRWLTWWLSTEPTEDDPALKNVSVTTLGMKPDRSLPFQVNTLEPVIVKSVEVRKYIRANSRNPAISLFLLEYNGDYYRLEPERRMEATIIDCTPTGYVLKTDTKHVFLTNMVSKRIQAQLQHQNLLPDDLIGTKVKVEYTMYTDGVRLCNYKSPIVYRCQSLDDLCDEPTPFVGTEHIFPVRNTASALLTVTRCSRALIYIDGGDVVGKETETGVELFRLTKTLNRGDYYVELERGTVTEKWGFSSPFSVDTLDPKGFIRCVTDKVYYATGFNLLGMGLYYHDKTAVAA